MWGFWNMGHYQEAAKIALQVKVIRPDDLEVKNILSWAPRQSDRKDESSLRQEAITDYQAGHFEKSARLYRELAQKEPDNIALLKEFMWALWYTERYDEASDVAHRVLALRPTETEAHDVMVRAPDQISRQKAAALEEEAKRDEDAGKVQEAISTYKHLLDVGPKNPMTYRTLIWALIREKQFDDAKTYALQLMALRPHDPESWNILAKVAAGLRGRSNGRCRLSPFKDQFLSSSPIKPDVLLSLGKFYTLDRQFETAIDYLQKVAELEPSLSES